MTKIGGGHKTEGCYLKKEKNGCQKFIAPVLLLVLFFWDCRRKWRTVESSPVMRSFQRSGNRGEITDEMKRRDEARKNE